MTKLDQLESADDILAEQLQDPTFRAAWETSAPARVLALRLVGYRLDHGLSQSALGRLLGMSQPAVARLEAGDHLPTIPTLIRIAQALDIEFLVDIRPSTSGSSWVRPDTEQRATVAERVTLTTGQELLVAAS